MKFTADQRKRWALAQERSRLNDLPGTLEILSKLVAEAPESAGLNATYANTLKEVGETAPAIEHFKRAVKLAPTVELYSLGLFHIYWAQGMQDEAFTEMRRFMASSDSADYREIVAEINSKWPNGTQLTRY
jgi:predicted Zn-dependent protease